MKIHPFFTTKSIHKYRGTGAGGVPYIADTLSTRLYKVSSFAGVYRLAAGNGTAATLSKSEKSKRKLHLCLNIELDCMCSVYIFFVVFFFFYPFAILLIGIFLCRLFFLCPFFVSVLHPACCGCVAPVRTMACEQRVRKHLETNVAAP